jgi:hypothetical protein
MKPKNKIMIFLTIALLYSLTGCYTQVATNEPDPYSTTTIYKQDAETSDYYSEDGEVLDSSYYSDIDPDSDGTITIINTYYDNPYNYFDYAFLPIGIGIGWYWGWSSLYSYWPYYPYYYGYWGCGWYYPSYCYYPSYGYYDPYYCNPYYGGGYYPYYGYGNGYYPRDEYVTRTRNNSGGRNNPEYLRDPMVTTSNGSIYKGRDDLNRGNDLTVERTNLTDRTLDIQKRTNETTRQLVGVNETGKIKNTRTNDISSNEITRTKQSRNDKQLGLDRELTTKKSLGINNGKDLSRETVKYNNRLDINNKIKNSNRIGNQTKELFNNMRSNTSNDKKNNVRTNNNTQQNTVMSNTKGNQTPRTNTNTRSYNPPKQNNNPPRSYSPPRGNNTPRSYSPPSGNNSPRSYSPPSGYSGGSRNSGGSRR